METKDRSRELPYSFYHTREDTGEGVISKPETRPSPDTRTHWHLYLNFQESEKQMPGLSAA